MTIKQKIDRVLKSIPSHTVIDAVLKEALSSVTQKRAERITGISQPHISAFLAGKQHWSLEKKVVILSVLGREL